MVRAGTLTSDASIYHFCQSDRAVLTISPDSPLPDWVTVGYSDPESEETSVLLVPTVMLARAAKAFLGMNQVEDL